MFSIVTVESSTRMPIASASPPSVMVLMVSPRKYSTMSEERIDSGIEIITTSVERQEPRNSTIISAVRTGGDGAFLEQPLDRRLDEYRLVEQLLDHACREAPRRAR